MIHLIFSDFGLSRCIDADVYMQKSDSKIPVKWYRIKFRGNIDKYLVFIGMHQKRLALVNLLRNQMFGRSV
jgi:hypothetical protein